MKFGKLLARNRNPNWADYYVRYDELKKMLKEKAGLKEKEKEREKEKEEEKEEAEKEKEEEKEEEDSKEKTKKKQSSGAGERRGLTRLFVEALRVDLSKVASFAKSQQSMLATRLKALDNHLEHLKAWKLSGLSNLDPHFDNIIREYTNLGNTLTLLLQYVVLNSVGLRKLLKKYDRIMGQHASTEILAHFYAPKEEMLVFTSYSGGGGGSGGMTGTHGMPYGHSEHSSSRSILATASASVSASASQRSSTSSSPGRKGKGNTGNTNNNNTSAEKQRNVTDKVTPVKEKTQETNKGGLLAPFIQSQPQPQSQSQSQPQKNEKAKDLGTRKTTKKRKKTGTASGEQKTKTTSKVFDEDLYDDLYDDEGFESCGEAEALTVEDHDVETVPEEMAPPHLSREDIAAKQGPLEELSDTTTLQRLVKGVQASLDLARSLRDMSDGFLSDSHNDDESANASHSRIPKRKSSSISKHFPNSTHTHNTLKTMSSKKTNYKKRSTGSGRNSDASAASMNTDSSTQDTSQQQQQRPHHRHYGTVQTWDSTNVNQGRNSNREPSGRSDVHIPSGAEGKVESKGNKKDKESSIARSSRNLFRSYFGEEDREPSQEGDEETSSSSVPSEREETRIRTRRSGYRPRTRFIAQSEGLLHTTSLTGFASQAGLVGMSSLVGVEGMKLCGYSAIFGISVIWLITWLMMPRYQSHASRKGNTSQLSSASRSSHEYEYEYGYEHEYPFSMGTRRGDRHHRRGHRRLRGHPHRDPHAHHSTSLLPKTESHRLSLRRLATSRSQVCWRVLFAMVTIGNLIVVAHSTGSDVSATALFLGVVFVGFATGSLTVQIHPEFEEAWATVEMGAITSAFLLVFMLETGLSTAAFGGSSTIVLWLVTSLWAGIGVSSILSKLKFTSPPPPPPPLAAQSLPMHHTPFQPDTAEEYSNHFRGKASRSNFRDSHLHNSRNSKAASGSTLLRTAEEEHGLRPGHGSRQGQVQGIFCDFSYPVQQYMHRASRRESSDPSDSFFSSGTGTESYSDDFSQSSSLLMLPEDLADEITKSPLTSSAWFAFGLLMRMTRSTLLFAAIFFQSVPGTTVSGLALAGAYFASEVSERHKSGYSARYAFLILGLPLALYIFIRVGLGIPRTSRVNGFISLAFAVYATSFLFQWKRTSVVEARFVQVALGDCAAWFLLASKEFPQFLSFI